MRISLIIITCATLLCGCRGTYYSVYEKFGVYKRDLLKKNVIKARDEEKETQEQFKDAMTRLKEITGFQGGDLEKHYDALKREYDRCAAKAESVHGRIKEVEAVARDLFAEWEKEIREISSENLRQDSRDKLRETRRRYEDLHAALKRAEKSMEPVLTRFRDQVLYLKHNLNAAAIASLKGEATNIQEEISRLLEEMNRAISQADQFINSLR